MNQEILERTKSFMDTQRVTIQGIALATGYSRTVMSRYINNKYESDTSEIEEKLLEFLGDYVAPVQEVSEQSSNKGIEKRTTFFESTDARNILGICDSCQEFVGLGIVIGRSGLGKTFTLKHYAKNRDKVAYIECDDMMSCRDLIEAIEKALDLPRSYGTNWNRINNIRDFCNINKGYLIIIDEADKLISKFTQKKMEILRGIFDQADVGMVIAGEPRLEVEIKNYLNRFANRIDFFLSMRGLDRKEVESYLSEYTIDPDALAELERRASTSNNGCFRLLDRTLNNAIRILKQSNEEIITMKSINKASSMMML